MARTRPGQGFEIEQSGHNLFDLKYNGRAVCYDREMYEIESEIRRRRQSGDPVTMIQPDGYRESIRT